ncbi:MAG: aminotransferase class III-fold pyridoxal phosphate-dependent enzyme [Nanoarchaeota archaeon]|nr:aminotransferase class III-fold pyridoxal phosphate-dependent enzyme [Nanoarchaeota archaeon]
MKAKIITKLPGIKSEKIINRLKKLNGAYNSPYPFVYSKEGSGAYFKDIDGNTFLDFASNIASTPLGYNHPNIKKVIRQYSSRCPIKYAGQDFNLKEHADLIEELLTTTTLNRAFLVNSGAEAVENSIKIAMRNNPKAKFGISFTSAFHGRTLGALSNTDSREVQKRNFFTIPTKRLPFSDEAPEELLRILDEEASPKEVAYVILEHVQGEGGYNPASKKMVKEIYSICKSNGITYIADEVQAGMGRTGEWWAHNHYNIKPNIFSVAKALQVGAAVSSKEFFPKEEGSLSSTWGGGHVIDMAVGLETIKTIKKSGLLSKNTRNGKYILKLLNESNSIISNPRGLGLMCAFDLPTAKMRDDVVIESLNNGLVILGCGKSGIRLIPPFIINKTEIDEAFKILNKAIEKCSKKGFRHRGKICNFLSCGEDIS